EDGLGLHWLIAGPISMFIAYIPLIGTIIGFIAAIKFWGWEWYWAGLLFFGWAGFALVLAIGASFLEYIGSRAIEQAAFGIVNSWRYWTRSRSSFSRVPLETHCSPGGSITGKFARPPVFIQAVSRRPPENPRVRPYLVVAVTLVLLGASLSKTKLMRPS